MPVAWKAGPLCQSRTLGRGCCGPQSKEGPREVPGQPGGGQAPCVCDQSSARSPSSHRWYKLHSKAGKKEKERGEIQVTIQFTRNNLSASMFDLSMKDKPRSPFSKIKDKMKGKKKYDLESASAILPSSVPGDPELGSLGKMGKAKGFFLRNKLRKSSLTQSNTSLGSDSTLSSASGSLAYQGPGAELLTRSPSRSSWLSTEGGERASEGCACRGGEGLPGWGSSAGVGRVRGEGRVAEVGLAPQRSRVDPGQETGLLFPALTPIVLPF